MSSKCFTDSEEQLQGYFFSDEPLQYVKRTFLVQVPLVGLVQGIFQVLLKPLGETPVVAQILGGVLIGPFSAGLISEKVSSTFFPTAGFTFHEILGLFGCMIHLFLIGVKMDLATIKRSSKKERVIGILTFSIPLLLTLPVSFIMKQDDYESWFHIAAVLESATSLHVISCFLADLKILNTELGRLATSTSTISGLCSWITIEITFAVKQNWGQESSIWVWFLILAFAQVAFITIVLRRVVVWIIRQSTEGEPLKEIYLFALFIMIFATGLMGELFGQHFWFGPMILGFAIPDGPPLGSTLAEKLEGFISGLFLPLFFFSMGSKMPLNIWQWETFWMIMLFSSLAVLGKCIGTILPCLYWQIPVRDAFTLALILSNLGIFDVLTSTIALESEVIRLDVFMYLIANILLVAAVISPVVHLLYKPSSRSIAHKKRTLQNAKRNAELPLLVCIYNEDIVPAILGILEASNPTRESPVVVYLLHMVELLGRATPLLIAHKPHEKLSNRPTASDHIINSFKIYEKQNQGLVFVQPFTAMTPVVTAHNDVCTIAADKRTCFIIIPFHKQWNIDGTALSSKWRNTNKKILDKAPCSVGILINRGHALSVYSGWSSYSVCVVFLGGADDREAMYYAMRMAEHSNIDLTVHQLIPVNSVINNVMDKRMDSDVINEYKLNNTGSERCLCKEHVMKDPVEIVSFVRTLQNAYDLILVGRCHDNYSLLLSGFSEWTEYPELGFFGDMFASPDFTGKISVLVIQQHSSGQNNVKLLGTHQEQYSDVGSDVVMLRNNR